MIRKVRKVLKKKLDLDFSLTKFNNYKNSNSRYMFSLHF